MPPQHRRIRATLQLGQPVASTRRYLRKRVACSEDPLFLEGLPRGLPLPVLVARRPVLRR
eukprot:1739936-Prorocentrum_lima.AAC.1